MLRAISQTQRTNVSHFFLVIETLFKKMKVEGTIWEEKVMRRRKR